MDRLTPEELDYHEETCRLLREKKGRWCSLPLEHVEALLAAYRERDKLRHELTVTHENLRGILKQRNDALEREDQLRQEVEEMKRSER